MKYLLIITLLFIFAAGKVEATELKGIASYYSVAGCLGCSPTLKMANGERLDDKTPTVALTPATVRKYKLLNDYVGIINLKNKKTIVVKVTDTGGFAKYNRVADLSLATKNALACDHLCNILIIF